MLLQLDMKMFPRAAILATALSLLLSLSGCASGQQEAPATRAVAVASPFKFRDVTQSSGIKFRHNNGAAGLKFLPETMGSGVAFIDYNGDGYQDIFLVNSRDWNRAEVAAFTKLHGTPPGLQAEAGRRDIDERHQSTLAAPTPHRSGLLYRNNRNGTFSDVTRQAGLDISMYGMGAAVGDYDNDGHPDLFVTGYGRNYLFHNAGDGTFREVAQQAGVRGAGWSTSAAWVDYNKDGRLDLFVCHYVQWSPQTEKIVVSENTKGYSGPSMYAPEPSRLFRNEGNGRFVDVSLQAGIHTAEGFRFQDMPRNVQARGYKYFRTTIHRGNVRRKLFGKSLGILICDYNHDSWPDLLVANDGTPNHLFSNERNGTFREVALRTGIAVTENGEARAGMGIDGGDIDHSGRESVLIGNFAMEMLGLYQNRGGLFVDQAPGSEVGRASRPFLTFGCALLDLDNDGWLDIFAANGPIPDFRSETMSGEMARAQRPLVFWNRGKAQFQEVGLQSGEALQKPVVARGLAHADIDLDGDSDVILTVNNGAPRLLLNQSKASGKTGKPFNALRIVLQGVQSNRSGIDAIIEARVGAETLVHRVRSGSSYLSQNELPATLGLGPSTRAAILTIRWPSGKVTRLKEMAANQSLTINETKGLVRRQPLKRP